MTDAGGHWGGARWTRSSPSASPRAVASCPPSRGCSSTMSRSTSSSGTGIWHIAKNAKSYRTRLLAKRMLADRIDPVPRPTDADTHRPPLTHVSFELRAGPEPATRIHVNGAEVHLGGSGWRHSEYLILGPRGEGKTITALAAMIAHGVEHVRAGHAAPTRWLGVRDSFENHKANVHQSYPRADLGRPVAPRGWRASRGVRLQRSPARGSALSGHPRRGRNRKTPHGGAWRVVRGALADHRHQPLRPHAHRVQHGAQLRALTELREPDPALRELSRRHALALAPLHRRTASGHHRVPHPPLRARRARTVRTLGADVRARPGSAATPRGTASPAWSCPASPSRRGTRKPCTSSGWRGCRCARARSGSAGMPASRRAR